MVNNNSINIIIEAKDAASQVLQTVSTSFTNLNTQSVSLSKSLIDSSLSLEKFGQKSDLINAITENFNDAAKSVSNYSTNLLNTLKLSLPSLRIAPIIDLSRANNFQNNLISSFDFIATKSQNTFDKITTNVTNSFNDIVSFANTSTKKILLFFNDIGVSISEPFLAAYKISQNFFNKLQVSVDNTQQELSNLGDTIIDQVITSFINLRSQALATFDAILPKSREFLSLVNPGIFTSRAAIVTGVITKTGDSAISTISNLIGLINQLQTFLSSPSVQPFIETIAKQAEKATMATASLSTILKNTAVISKDFGKGFFGASSGASNSVDKFAQDFVGKAFEKIAPSIDLIDRQITKAFEKISSLPSKVSGNINQLSNLPLGVSGLKEFQQIFGATEQIFSGFTSGISTVIEKVNFFGETINNLQRIASTGAFRLLIGQAIELKEQLLSTQSSLVGTSKIIDGLTGKQIVDPKQAILSLEKPISDAIENLRTESLDLVGITSNDLVPLYQQIATTITGMGGGLNDAKNLSLDFAATLGTLNIPLYQSRQEIGSILTATIDQNSVLAKSLNISNDQVNNWKAQGRLVEELRKRLEPFRAGNAIAARTFGGVTSNIREIFDNIGRKAGEKLLDPLVEQLNTLYDYLNKSEAQFVTYFTGIASDILRAGLAVADALKTITQSTQGLIAQLPVYIFSSLAEAAEIAAQAIQLVTTALQPAITVLSTLFQLSASGPLLALAITMKTLVFGISALGTAFKPIIDVVPGLGEAIFLLDLRTKGVVNQFATLSESLGKGGAGFLVFGKYLESIPGASAAVSKALGPMGDAIVGLIPTIATIGIQLTGLVILFPAIGAFLENILVAAPAAIRSIGALAAGNSLFAPLAVSINSAATAVETYALATNRAEFLNQQFAAVIIKVGKAIAGQVLAFGVLAAGAYTTFLIIDKFILKNETLGEIFQGLKEGLITIGQLFLTTITNPIGIAVIAVTGLAIAFQFKLLPALYQLIATQFGAWLAGAATGVTALSGALGALGLVELAASATTAGVGLQALSIFFLQGSVASTAFLTANGITTTGLFGLTAATGGATAGVATFATALYTAIAPLLALLAPVLVFAAALAGIGLGLYYFQLKDSNRATEILADQTARLSNEAIKTATNLKKAKDIQAEADKRGVRLADEQYAANKRLIAQANLQKEVLTQQIAELKQRMKEANNENKANLQAQIDELEARQKLIDPTSLQITSKDLERLGSGYEQLAKKAAGAEDAILKSSGDSNIFKQKSEELLASTEKQSEAGQISANEAIRRYNLVATNAFASQELQDKAQQAITAAFKHEADKRVGIVQAEQADISAQLSLGKVEYEKNAQAIADVQNSALKLRLDAEQAAHETKLAQIQKEFDNQIFVNTELLRQKEEAANIEAKKNADREASLQQLNQAEINRVKAAILEGEKSDGSKRNAFQELDFIEKQNGLKQQVKQLELDIEASKTRQALAEKTAKDKAPEVDVERRKALQDKIVKIEKDKNAALASETTRNAKTNSELNSQIIENESAANKLAADLRVKVRTGAISQELAAERLLTFAKKTELETQLRNINDNYAERRKIIERDFANTTNFLSDAITKKQAEADKLPKDSKEYEAAQSDITLNNTKLINATRTKNSALLNAENNYKVEVTKINADVQKNQADSAEKEASIAIKILERNQKKTLDAVQKAQNERIIQVQQLENKGLLDHTEVEEKKTEASKINIAAQLNEERLRLKALQALPKPKNQEKGAELDTQIRASQLKVQDLVKSSLDAELKLYHDHIAVIVGNIKDEDTLRETQLENQSRRGLLSQNQVAEELARRKIASLEQQYALETKDTSKRIDLASQIEKAKTDLQNKRIATVLGNIKDEDTVREAQLENQSRRGLIVQSQVNEELARRKVASLEKELALEVSNASKRKELALAIEKAKTALLDAEIKTRQEKLELQNQKLKNQIDEQNQGIKRQGDLYGILTKALEQRNKLQEIARDLDKAGTDYITGELEVLSSIERSEYRKKELAEITASIKLRSLARQQEFEKQSLLNQIQQNQLALEQEAIQNRIAQGDKVASIAGVKADIAIAQADPRNNTEAGRAKIEALQVKLQADLDSLGNLQAEAGLIVKKAEVQDRSAKAQLEQLGLKQKLESFKAEAEFANTLPPGKRQQALRKIQQEGAEDFGQDNIQGLYNAGIAQSRQLAKQLFGTSTNPDILGAINPELGGILDQVSGRAAAAAIADTKQAFEKQYGGVENITGALTTGIPTHPFQAPTEVQNAQKLSDQISREVLEGTIKLKADLAEIQSLINTSTSEEQKAHLEKVKLQKEGTLDYLSKINPEAIAKAQLNQPASLRLPAPAERGVFLSLETSGMLFKAAVDKLVDYLKDQNSTSKKANSTYNIKVEAQQKSVTTSGKGNEPSLENVLALAKQLAGA